MRALHHFYLLLSGLEDGQVKEAVVNTRGVWPANQRDLLYIGLYRSGERFYFSRWKGGKPRKSKWLSIHVRVRRATLRQGTEVLQVLPQKTEGGRQYLIDTGKVTLRMDKAPSLVLSKGRMYAKVDQQAERIRVTFRPQMLDNLEDYVDLLNDNVVPCKLRKGEADTPPSLSKRMVASFV